MTKQQEKSLNYYNDLIKYVEYYSEHLPTEAYLCHFNDKRSAKEAKIQRLTISERGGNDLKKSRCGDFKSKKEVIELSNLLKLQINIDTNMLNSNRITRVIVRDCDGSWFFDNDQRIEFIKLCIKLVKKEPVTTEDVIGLYVY